MSETVFITGFPGFIASRLVHELARTPANFLLLVQPAFAQRARAEVQEIASETGRNVGDFALLPGDITSPNLGLGIDELAKARAETTVLFHLAAIYDLAVAREPAMRINLGGTQNVNDFARSVATLRHYHYVSTCYVAGKRRGVILETELEHNAGFRNYYEETKYLAELEVDRLKNELPVTIHRPSVVCGDSRTGETMKYDGIYFLIRYLLKSPKLFGAFNIGNQKVSLNLVPVDFVVSAMTALASDKRAIGKTIQIADPNPFTTEQLFDAVIRSLRGRESRWTIPTSLIEWWLMTPVSPRLSGLPHSAVPYFFLKQTYDTAEATRLLEPLGIRCPNFDTYAKTITEFAATHPVL